MVFVLTGPGRPDLLPVHSLSADRLEIDWINALNAQIKGNGHDAKRKITFQLAIVLFNDPNWQHMQTKTISVLLQTNKSLAAVCFI